MDQRMDRVLANDSGVTEGGKRCSRRNPKSSSRDSTGLVTQNHRPRPELLAAHEPQIEPLAQAGEQRRPVARQDGLHDKLVLIDQSQIRQGHRGLHASHEQAFARLPLELLNGFPQVPRTSSAFQSTRSRVPDTTYFFAPSIFRAKGTIQSGRAPVRADGRHAASIIS